MENQYLLENCNCLICFVLQPVFQHCSISVPHYLTLYSWHIISWKPQRFQDLNLEVEKHWAICAYCQKTTVLKYKSRTNLPREILPGVNHVLKGLLQLKWFYDSIILQEGQTLTLEKRTRWLQRGGTGFLWSLGKLVKTVCILRKKKIKI